MIQIANRNGEACPIVLCDVCGKEITDAHGAIYTWDSEHPWEEIDIVHKGRCDQTNDPNRRLMSGELTLLPVYLAVNTGANKISDLDDAYEHAKLLASIWLPTEPTTADN